MAGTFYRPNYWINPGFAARGYHVVSAGYRLLPVVSIEDQVDDLVNAFAWCRNELPRLCGPDTIDINSCVVAGDSAGGFFSAHLGHLLRPSPKCVLILYGITDPTNEWFNVDGINQAFEDWEFHHSMDQVIAAVKNRDLSTALTNSAYPHQMPPERTQDEMRLLWGTEYVAGDKDWLQMDVLHYVASHALFFRIGYRRDAFTTEEEWMRHLRSVSSQTILEQRQTYPPTVLMHGTKDLAVPVEQSYAFENKLREYGIPVLALYLEGGDHVFEINVVVRVDVRELADRTQSESDPLWARFVAPTLDFVDSVVKIQ